MRSDDHLPTGRLPATIRIEKKREILSHYQSGKDPHESALKVGPLVVRQQAVAQQDHVKGAAIGQGGEQIMLPPTDG